MKRAWFFVCVAALAPLSVAVGCGDDNKTKKGMEGDGGAEAEGGSSGDPSAAGSSNDPGAAGQGGAAIEPGGGNAGTAINAGASTGGADGSSGGADSSSGGVDGSAGGADGGSAFTNACAYPNGGECDEISGTSEQTGMFELECLNNERLVLEACPATNIAGVCTFEWDGANRRTVHYNPLDVDELAEAEQRCIDLPGEWTTP